MTQRPHSGYTPSKLALLLTVAYLALAPLLPIGISAHDGSRLMQVGLLAAAALLGAASPIGRIVTPLAWLRACAVGIFALACASIVTAPHRAAALQEFALLLGLGSLVLHVYRAARAGPMDWAFNGLLIGSCGYFAVTSAIYAAALINGDPLNARLLHLGFDNPRFFNHVQTLAAPVLLGWSINAAPGAWQRRAGLLVAGLHFAWLFLDVARASLLALAAAGLWSYWVGSRSFGLRLATASVAGAVIYGLLFLALPALLGRDWVTTAFTASELASAHSRDLLAGAALDLIHASPWLGAGPMQFAALAHAKGAHPHSLYLQWAAEFGLPSLGMLLVALLTPLWRVSCLLRRRSLHLPPMTTAWGAALLAAMVDAGFSGNFVMPLSQVWIALVYGLVLSALPALERSGPRSSAPKRACLLLLAAVQLGLFAETWRQWQYDPPRIYSASPIANAEQSPRPRFWQQGWL